MVASIRKIAGVGETSGSPAWTQPNRVVSSDDSRAYVSIPAQGTTGVLWAHRFDFQNVVPQNALILGVKVEVERQCAQSGTSLKDVTIQLTDQDGELVGDNQANVNQFWPKDSAIAEYGGADDMWGVALTPNIINSAQFGVVVVVTNTHLNNARNAGIDAIWITVYYEATPIPLIWMCGGGLAGFQPENDDAIFDELVATVRTNLAGNDHVTGVFVGAYWRNIETAEGVYAWTRLDGILDEILLAGRTFKIALMPGIQSPPWLLAMPGVDLFHTTIQNPNRPNQGDPVSIPIPWNPTYQEKWFATITALADHLEARGYLVSCYAVTVSPWAFMSSELHLPKSADDLAAWAAVDAWNQLPQVMADTIDHYAGAFPAQRLALHTPFNILGDGRLTNAVVDAALTRQEDRLDIQSNAMQGKFPLRDNPRYVKCRDWQLDYPGIRLGAQSLASMALPVDRYVARQGTMRQTITNVLDTGLGGYFEIWHSDGLSHNKCEAIANLLAGGDYIGGNEGPDDDDPDDGGIDEPLFHPPLSRPPSVNWPGTYLADITARHWQPALGAEGIVTDAADIRQAIQIILSTPKGADPHRPEFGSDLWRYLDYPVDRAIPHIIREAVDAVLRWEPRVTLLALSVTPQATGQILLSGQWRLATGVRETFEVLVNGAT